jgi:DNA-binding CsgD family transcriptional regulator
MLQSKYLAVMETQSKPEFREALIHFTQDLGFQTVSATMVLDHMLGQPEFITVDNTPEAFRLQFANSNNGRRDPVMQHCRHKSLPIIWERTTYAQHGQADLWEEQARFGYCYGVAMALHMPDGRHFFIGVDRDQPMPSDSAELTRLVADLQLLTVHAQEAAARILIPSSPAVGAVSLTPREMEALRWTMEAKTAWEVGNILGISERTAVLHVNNAMHKLGCVNKHQAVLKALRLGIFR